MSKENFQVFLVTYGEYSDYQVCGVFKSQSDAIQYIENSEWTYDDPMIEQFIDDEHLTTWKFDTNERKLSLYWEKEQGFVL